MGKKLTIDICGGNEKYILSELIVETIKRAQEHSNTRFCVKLENNSETAFEKEPQELVFLSTAWADILNRQESVFRKEGASHGNGT